MEQQQEAVAMREMPRYKCHKEVWALKIAQIVPKENPDPTGQSAASSYGARIVPADEGYGAFDVDAAYVNKHQPQVGGYYVVYDDGYKSYSPAAPFEAGYTLITGVAQQNESAPEDRPTTFQERVLAEREQLHARLGKLRGFIGTDAFNALEPGERDRLERQEEHMARYLAVLDERTAHFPA